MEFEKFGNMLVKAQKQINTANNTLDSLISTRTNAIIRALNTVESYQDQATKSLLNLPPLEEETIMKISQMKKDELFEGFYLIKSAELRKTRAGKDYIAFTFQDDSGEISGNLWDAQPYNVEEYTAGKVVYMKGRREVYNGTPQVNQITLRNTREGEPNDPRDFKEKSPVDVLDVKEYLEQMMFKIENAVWQRVFVHSIANMTKNSLRIQLLKLITMLLSQA